MNKNQISQGTHASVLSTANRKPLGARVLLVLLFLALSLASVQPRVSAKDAAEGPIASKVTGAHKGAIAPSCPECQQALTDCLNNGGSNCYGVYTTCMATCQ